MITHHTNLLNYLIERYNLKSYLEVGVQNPANNFHKINCDLKIGVDPCIEKYHGFRWGSTNQFWALFPDESDTWFKRNQEGSDTTMFDICFIDGLHHADQVQRDFENSLKCLNDGGFIVIHDTCPDEEIATCVPRGNQKKWFGDVYKFAMNLYRYLNIQFFTLDIDCGCTVAWKINNHHNPPALAPVSWAHYLERRKALMQIILPSEIEKYLPVEAAVT